VFPREDGSGSPSNNKHGLLPHNDHELIRDKREIFLYPSNSEKLPFFRFLGKSHDKMPPETQS